MVLKLLSELLSEAKTPELLNSTKLSLRNLNNQLYLNMKTNIIIATLAACMLLHGNPVMGQGISFSEFFGGGKDKIEASKKTTTYEVKNLESFERIKLAGSGTVEYHQSTDGQTRVTVTIAENLRDYMQIEVVGGVLRIHWKTERYQSTEIINGTVRTSGKSQNYQITGDPKLKIVCESPWVDVVEVAGSGIINIPDAINGRRIALKVAGSGEIHTTDLVFKEIIQAEVAGSGKVFVNGHAEKCLFRIAGSGEIAGKTESKQLIAEISGSGDIDLQGTAQKANLRTTGSGEIHAHELKAENVYAQITGSGDIDCYVTGELTTKVTGSGEITYNGNPAVINSNNVKKSNTKQVDTEEVMEGL